MALVAVGQPLQRIERPLLVPGRDEVLLRVAACGVCRTDLHVVDGELPAERLPLVPGHEVVGAVVARGADVRRFEIGDRVGVPWLGGTCGVCPYCHSRRENLCDAPQFTGYTRDGGYAQHVVARADFCFRLPGALDDVHAAPLLCAGLIGYRALRMAGDAQRLGIYGFGAAAHLIAQVAVWQKREVYAFTRPGDVAGQDFARSLGCAWAGGSDTAPPRPLDAALIFAPVGSLLPTALANTVKGGVVVCAGIHMSDIPAFPYEILWGERMVKSVANLTRADGDDFMRIAAEVPIEVNAVPYELIRANEAIHGLRKGAFTGATVLVP